MSTYHAPFSPTPARVHLHLHSGLGRAGAGAKALGAGAKALGVMSRLAATLEMLHMESSDGGRDYRLVVGGS